MQAHFDQSLNGDDGNNPAGGMTSPNPNQIHENIEEVVTPDLEEEEVPNAIKWLKNSKAAGFYGLPAELFKAGGDVCHFLKNDDAAVYTNNRGISFLNIAYKNVLCERLKPYVEKLNGSYKCGLRLGKSTSHQIFTLRQIVEKPNLGETSRHTPFLN